MKTTHYSFRSFRPPALQGIVWGLLASGFIVCRAFASDATVPPAPKDASGTVTLPPVIASSGSNGSPVVSGDLSASAGDVGSATVGPGLVARMGDINIKADYLRSLIAGLDSNEQAAMAGNPALLKRVVFSLLVQQIVLKEIAAKQWDQQPEVEAHLERVRETTLADMYLKTIASPPKEYPSTAELKSAYEARKNTFIVPHRFQITQIFIASPQGADEVAIGKVRGKLEAIVKSLKQPDADFAAIARAQSDDTKSAAQNGDMGWIADKDMPPRIRAQAINLPKDTASEPIRLDDGWHIIKVINSGDPAPISFEDIKGDLTQQLRAERLQSNMQAYVNKLLQQNPVTIDDKLLPQAMASPITNSK